MIVKIIKYQNIINLKQLSARCNMKSSCTSITLAIVWNVRIVSYINTVVIYSFSSSSSSSIHPSMTAKHITCVKQATFDAAIAV